MMIMMTMNANFPFLLSCLLCLHDHPSMQGNDKVSKGKTMNFLNASAKKKKELTMEVYHLIGKEPSSSHIQKKDEFMMEMTRLLGDTLVAPLIEIICQFTRSFYIFSCGYIFSGGYYKRIYQFYDHFTRQIIDKQLSSWKLCNRHEYVLLNGGLDGQRRLYMVTLFDKERDDHIAIYSIRYDVNRIYQQRQKLEAEVILEEWSSFTRNALVLTSDYVSLFFRKPDYQWQRFDLGERKWDSVLIQDKTNFDHQKDELDLCIVGKETLNVTSIGRRSFIGIEAFYLQNDVSMRHTYRCFVYDGDSIASNDSKKHVLLNLENIVARGVFPHKLLVFGLVKNGVQEMILVIFDLTMAFIIKILTRSPSLTFSRPTRIPIDTRPIPTIPSIFILEEQLWFVNENMAEPRNLAYCFSFQTMKWILSGTMPRELCTFNSKLQTII